MKENGFFLNFNTFFFNLNVSIPLKCLMTKQGDYQRCSDFRHVGCFFLIGKNVNQCCMFSKVIFLLSLPFNKSQKTIFTCFEKKSKFSKLQPPVCTFYTFVLGVRDLGCLKLAYRYFRRKLMLTY